MASQVKKRIANATGLSSAGSRRANSNRVKKWMKTKYRRKSEGGNGG